jgi:hypothetical protein
MLILYNLICNIVDLTKWSYPNPNPGTLYVDTILPIL